MNNFLLLIGALLILLLGAAFAVPLYVDWNEYRATFEDEATRIVGRPIRVGGNVDFRLLPTPYIRFEKLRIADRNGRFRDPIFKADGVKLWLSMTPLIQGAIEARHVELTRPRLRLEFDEDGKGKWHKVTMRTGDASVPLPTGDLSIQSLSMSEGAIALVQPDGSYLMRLKSVNGEFRADNVLGPYNFTGDFLVSGRRRKVRLATGKLDKTGSLTVKGTVKSRGGKTATASSGRAPGNFIFDGKLKDIFASPKLLGNLSAKIPFSLQNGGDSAAGGSNDKAQTTSGNGAGDVKPVVFDLRSQVKADAKVLALNGVSLSFEQAGRPQLLSGDITSTWGHAATTRASFSSLWLDLDRIAGGATSDGPVIAMARLVAQLKGLFGEDGTAEANLSIDQANLGGDVVSDIRLDLAQADKGLLLKSLQAQLPGRARIIANGRIGGAEGARDFDGDLVIHGGNLRQFEAWAFPSKNSRLDLGSGSFSMNSAISAGPGRLLLSRMNGQIDGTELSGKVNYQWGKTRSIALDLKAPSLDASKLLPRGLRIGELIHLLKRPWDRKTATATATPGTGQAANAAGPLPAKSVKLRIGSLLAGDERYQDVELDLSLKNGVLDAPVIRLRSGKDLAIDISARVSGMDKTPLGTARGQVKALSAEAIAGLMRIFDIPISLRPAKERREALAPLRLAGRLTLGAPAGDAAPAPVNLVLSGTTAGGRAQLTASLAAGFRGWRDDVFDLALTVQNPDGAKLLRQLLPAQKTANTTTSSAANAAAAATGGAFQLNLIGTAARRLQTKARVATARFRGDFDGFLELKPRQPPAKRAKNRPATGPRLAQLTGKLNLSAQTPWPLLAALGLDGRLAAHDTPVSGRISVTARPELIALEDIELNVAGSGLTGSARLAHVAGATTSNGAPKPSRKRRLTANLTASRLPALALFAPALQPLTPGDTVASGTSSSQPGQPGQTLWPTTPFNFKALSGLTGDIKLTTATLSLGDDMKLTNAAINLTLSEDKLVLRQLRGDALGGKLTSAMELSRALAGANLRGTLKLQGAELERLIASQQPQSAAAATGRASLTMSFNGQALSPRGLISAINGSGIVSIGDARLHRMNPAAIAASADAVLDQKPDDQDAAIRQELTQRLMTGDFTLGPRQVKLTISDGAMRADRFQIDMPEGTIYTTNTVDLAGLALDSEWQIRPKAQVSQITGKQFTALPPVTITYVGSLGKLAALEPQINAGALVRELTVRKMERDVEKLEQLRRADEERARQEAERQRREEAIEQARQRALLEAERLRQQRSNGATNPPSGAAPDGAPNDARLQPLRTPGDGATLPPQLQVPAGRGNDLGRATPKPRRAQRPRKASNVEENWNPFIESGR